MKTTIAVSIMLLSALTVFAAGDSTHDTRGYYSQKDVKSGTKNIDKGIEVTLSSNDPQIVRRLQEDIQYYENALTDEDYYCNDDYSASDVKTEVKKTDKGIRISFTSDDPQIAGQIQKDAAYYEATLTDEGYYCHHNRGHMFRRPASAHHCCDCGW